jgi:excisionase family DNA binding protein
MSAERLITVAEAARSSGLAPWTLYRLVRSGQVPSVLIGAKTRRVRLSDVLGAIRESKPTI